MLNNMESTHTYYVKRQIENHPIYYNVILCKYIADR